MGVSRVVERSDVMEEVVPVRGTDSEVFMPMSVRDTALGSEGLMVLYLLNAFIRLEQGALQILWRGNGSFVDVLCRSQALHP